MQLDDPALGHLTYCTNIHAAEHWPDVRSGLNHHLPTIKAQFSPDKPMGVGLRVAGSAATALEDPNHLAELRALLQENNCYVFTINGFPYGTFHGQSVKENAYRPDWAEPDRLHYTNSLADLLAQILPSGTDGSISTVPGTFKPWAQKHGAVDAIVANLIAHAAHLVKLHERTGQVIALALEPEPHCLLETIAETVAFFDRYLFSESAVRTLADQCGLTNTQAQAALKRHLGVCYDVCHAAVEFEDPRASVDALRNAGIGIPKLQLSSAMRVASVNSQTAQQMAPFDEPVYLHQVVQQSHNGELTRYVDLNEALATADAAIGAEWRIHFHVPLFLEDMETVGTTQAYLREILALHREQPISAHLEVETYSWGALPERYRELGMGAAIARELNWVKDQLHA